MKILNQHEKNNVIHIEPRDFSSPCGELGKDNECMFDEKKYSFRMYGKLIQ